MATFASPVSTYSDTTPHKRAITDVISLIDPYDTPLISLTGGLDGAAGKFRFTNTPGKVVEWLEDNLLPMSDTMNESASITSTVTTITITDGNLYEKGDIIMIESEYLWVSSVNLSTNVVTVTRGVAGSTAATHASTTAVSFIGQARIEGADSDSVGFTDRYVGSNVTQIFHREVKVSRSQAKLAQYGIADEVSYQKDKVIPDLMRRIERHLLYNKALSAGSATTARWMGGLQAFISTNKVSGANLNQTAFENAVLSAYNNGGSGPYVAICAPANMQKIKNWYDNYSTTVNTTTILRVGTDQRSVGMKIENIVTPFGDVNLVMDRWASTSIIPIISPENAGMLTYDPFAWEDLAKDGDYTKAEIVGEFTFCLRQEKSHALLTAVS